MLTCDDGSGALTVRLVDTEAERTPGRTGIWQVIEGSGSYAELRGMGTLTGVRLGDDAAQPETLRFRTEWKGLIDFDVVAPPIVVLRSSSSERPAPLDDLHWVGVAPAALVSAATIAATAPRVSTGRLTLRLPAKLVSRLVTFGCSRSGSGRQRPWFD
jgi:hypothetical protein